MKTGTTTHYVLCRFRNAPDAACRQRHNEIAAWAHAVSLADGAPTYGREAGEYIAEQAVEIEEIADDAE